MKPFLKDSFFAILSDVLDLDFIFGGALGANNFYSLRLQFFLWFRAIFSRVPTHLTTGQLKILPPTPGKTGGLREPNITETL